jgi:hypothetical protein
MRRSLPAVAVVVVLGVAVASVWHTLRGPDTAAVSCSWSADVQHANPVQEGLIRCYLRAIADRSTKELRSVVPARGDDGPTGFGSEVFAHAADARSGPASVDVVGNDVDDADATVDIRYADGARESLDIHIANPASANSWRFSNVGTYPADPGTPLPAVILSSPSGR